jgi:hypothetical protein
MCEPQSNVEALFREFSDRELALALGSTATLGKR